MAVFCFYGGQSSPRVYVLFTLIPMATSLYVVAPLGTPMGSVISSPNDTVSYAGELRRAATQAVAPEDAQKIRQSAADLEKAGLAKVGLAGPGIGALLDTFA